MENSFSIAGTIVDVIAGAIFPGTVTVKDGKIISVEKSDSVPGPFILPGLIDAHVHIESSMLVPSEFARLAVVHGTVGTVSDPHEIANVLGIDGIRFMVENGKQSPFHFYFGVPSCVPATGFETAGCVIGPEEVEALIAEPEFKYLSEMMNFPGVLFRDPAVMAKLRSARNHGKPIDGHAPGLSGDGLKAYAGEGISTDHECISLEEAEEKISFGMHILVREGSAARNFDNLIPLLGSHPDKIMFCSDDKHPDDLVHGHMNLLLRRAVAAGFDPMAAIRACTLNPVKHYGLDCGLLQPGDNADFILCDSLIDFNVQAAYIGGVKVAADGVAMLKPVSCVAPNRFELEAVSSSQLKVPAERGLLKVIEAYDGELVTGKLLLEPSVVSGEVVADTGRDILKIAVVNRYNPSAPAVGFIRGFGLKKGAIASTVAHDSHNLICVGTSDEEMLKAMRLLIGARGGIALTYGTESLTLPLPIAGLMTDADGTEVARLYVTMNEAVRKLGSTLRAPFMTLSFMALLVIPELKMSDRGLFDGNEFSFTKLFERQ